MMHPAIRVTRHWQNSKFVQTISLQGDQVDIDNDIDWHESHVLLKAAFPLAARAICDVRDSLWHHRAADHAQ